MERQRAEEGIKKGPWTAEEDEILKNFVNENGPKDWSSIRSKGLLPRTGKSCRLRWVNKLQPNLKKGCKFSAEEERVVLELQATVGNKWAAIATYLPGRTDNDVKNFWSTRQKRLARILRSSSQPNRTLKKRGKAPIMDEASSSLQIQASKFSSSNDQVQSASSLLCNICSCLCSENFNAVNMLLPPQCLTPYVVDVNASVTSMVHVHTNPCSSLFGMQSNDIKPSTYSANEISLSTTQPIKPTANDDELSLVQENDDFCMDFGEPNFMEGLSTHHEPFQLGNMAPLNLGLSMEQLEATAQNYVDTCDYKDKMITVPDNVFDDFSADMLDNL